MRIIDDAVSYRRGQAGSFQAHLDMQLVPWVWAELLILQSGTLLRMM